MSLKYKEIKIQKIRNIYKEFSLRNILQQKSKSTIGRKNPQVDANTTNIPKILNSLEPGLDKIRQFEVACPRQEPAVLIRR